MVVVTTRPGAPALGRQGRSLLDVDELGAEGITALLDRARELRSADPTTLRDRLTGSVVVNLFLEPSTRTRVSFEIAACKLGAEVVNISEAGSSVVKGESLIDTVRTLEALGADAVVLRCSHAGAPYLLTRHYGGSVVNAGDGLHAHPTQALLDVMTIQDHHEVLRGLRVAILGDVQHSRVARSTVLALLLLGAQVVLCGPPTLLPPRGWEAALPSSDRGGSVHTTTIMEAALAGADVVMALRMQSERQQAGLLPDLKEYVRMYGLTRERLDRLTPGALIMHPGPVNEGVELAPDLVAAPDSLISEQVANGVWVRAAVLEQLLGEGL